MRKIRIAAAGAVVTAVVLVASTATYAAATHQSHPGPAGPLIKQAQTPHQVVAAGGQKLKSSVLASGYSGATLPGGFTPIDAGETLTCGGTTSCTFEADMSVQAESDAAGNEWAICFYVVDLSEYATCPFYGNLDNAFYENGTQIESIAGIPPGTHTVQMQVYTSGTGAAYNYSVTYHSYKP